MVSGLCDQAFKATIVGPESVKEFLGVMDVHQMKRQGRDVLKIES